MSKHLPIAGMTPVQINSPLCTQLAQLVHCPADVLAVAAYSEKMLAYDPPGYANDC